MQRTLGAVLAAAALATTGCQQQGSLAGVLATGEAQVTSIAVDDGFVYWTRADGTVKKVSLDTGVVSVVSTQTGIPGNLVLDDENLYWSVDSTLLRIPKAGGALETHPQTATIRSLSIDEASVYWSAEDNSVNRAAKVGLAVQTLATSDNPRPILAGAAGVTWGAEATDGALFQVPAGGGTVSTLLPTASTAVWALAQDTEHIFWGSFSDSTTADGTINMMAPDTSNPQVLAVGQNTPVGLVTDSSHVYWSDVAGQVQAVSLSGGDPQQLVLGPASCPTSPAGAPVSIAMDASSIYWANACDDAILTMPRL